MGPHMEFRRGSGRRIPTEEVWKPGRKEWDE